MGLLERLGFKTAKVPFDVGNGQDWTASTLIMPWLPVNWLNTEWRALVNDIYLVNGAVCQCILKLAQGYPEPPPVVKVKNEPDLTHPLQLLLNRPNPQMSHAELMTYSIIYRAVGGNVYLHKVRNTLGEVVELWPYHAGQMWPVPSRFGWVEEYEYEIKTGTRERVPTEDVIHLKWPMIDLTAPYRALSPLVSIAREVLSDSEATRVLAALLQNNAVPQGVVTLPEGTAMSPDKAEKLRAKWKQQHGGDNRGGIVILEHGAKYERIAMSLQELSFDALRRVPETRIAGAFGVPPIVAGLNVGLERATYANYAAAVTQMTRGTFVPLWRSDAAELTQALQTEFDGDPVVTYDLGKVAALQESEDAKYKRVLDAFDRQIITQNESRQSLGFVTVGELKRVDPGDVFIYELPKPMILDMTPRVPQLVDSDP